MATHSSTLAWKIPWMEELGRLWSMGVVKSLTWLSDFAFTFQFHALEKEMATHSSVLAWRIPGTVEPGGLPSMGSHRVRHDWSDLAAAAVVVRTLHFHYRGEDSLPGQWTKIPHASQCGQNKISKHNDTVHHTKITFCEEVKWKFEFQK